MWHCAMTMYREHKGERNQEKASPTQVIRLAARTAFRHMQSKGGMKVGKAFVWREVCFSLVLILHFAS